MEQVSGFACLILVARSCSARLCSSRESAIPYDLWVMEGRKESWDGSVTRRVLYNQGMRSGSRAIGARGTVGTGRGWDMLGRRKIRDSIGYVTLGLFSQALLDELSEVKKRPEAPPTRRRMIDIAAESLGALSSPKTGER